MTTSDMGVDSGQALDPDEFRRAMSEFASGVTVVTALHEGEPFGFVCQSFASVSLEPPLVMFCAGRTSRSWPRIRAAGRFAVNVLGENQQPLCESFGSRRGRKFEDVPWAPSSWGTPSLAGVLMRVHADVEQVVPAGDHDVVVGRVLATERLSESRPMIFFRGGFSLPASLTTSAPAPGPRPDAPRGRRASSGAPG
ncbi:flavin reductase family protein [Streptomyces albidoflavus]